MASTSAAIRTCTRARRSARWCARARRPTGATCSRRCASLVFDDREGRAGGDRLALLDRQLGDDARLVGGDLVLHLHRLDDRDELALLDLLTLLDEDLPHVALQRRRELVAATAATAALAGAAPGRLPART